LLPNNSIQTTIPACDGMHSQNCSNRSSFRALPLTRVIVLAGLLCLSFLGGAIGQEPTPLFDSDEALEVVIRAPWRTIVRDRKNQDAYPAVLGYRSETGELYEIPLTVERRGKTRQQVCRFPPIKLRLSRTDTEGTLFEGNKSIKMVTHCDNGRRWESYYVLEMLAYRIYNLVTERSFRIRPLSITYHDDQRDRDDGPRFGFLIEDDKLVAKRNGLKRFDLVEIRPERLDALESSRFALFQYLIGNVDWSSLGGPAGEKCCHNAKLIGPKAGEPLYALPYDFDSSGLVDAHYAAPNEHLPISSVTDRLFRGFCTHNSTLHSARLELLALRDQILSIVGNEERLRPGIREEAIAYLVKSFEVFQDPREFERKITGVCRK